MADIDRIAPLLATLARLFRGRALLHLEFLALRQQLATLAARDSRKPRIRHHERLFWIWQTFLDNHARDLVSINFFTVPTVRKVAIRQLKSVANTLAGKQRSIVSAGGLTAADSTSCRWQRE